MKIEDYTAQVNVLPQPPAKTERTDQAGNEAHAESAAKLQKSKDKVQLSGLSPAAIDNRDNDVARAQRVEALKASVSAGKYQVPARAVAESLLAKISGSRTQH